MNIQNRIVLVTGANRGIGKAIVESLLQNGVKKIYAAARDLASLPDFNDARITPLKLDIVNAADIALATKTAHDIDMLINNAGVAAFSSAADGDFDLVRRDMDVNYFGTLNMCRAFIPVLEKNASSSIVNVASIAAFVNFPILGGYSASKAALFSISQGLRIELAPKNIGVHTVNPGPIDTDMAKDLPMEKSSPADAAKNIITALKNNEADIFPDDTSKQMFATWQQDYRQLEAMVYESTHATEEA